MILIVQKQISQFSVQKQVVLRVKILEFNIPSGITNSAFTQPGEVIVGTGAGTYVVFPPGADGEYLQYDSSAPAGVKTSVPSLEIEDSTNYAVNGGFDFAQEQTPGTLTKIADGEYGPDQWKCYRENADLQYRRVSGSGISGLTSPYYGEWKKITNAGKMLVCQPLEYLETVRFRGRTVSFQLKMNSNAARTMKLAILELQAAGVADTIPAVVSAWNANGTDPTFGANLAVITTPVSCDVTTTMQAFTFSGDVPSTSKNLLLAIWSDSDFAANDTLGVGEAGVYYGATQRAWTPINRTLEIQKIRRYVWKTFGIDIKPEQNAGYSGAIRSLSGKAGAVANSVTIGVKFPVAMFANPNVTTFNPAAANAQVRDTTAAVDCSSTSISGLTISPDTCTVHATGNAATAVGNIVEVHLLAKAQL